MTSIIPKVSQLSSRVIRVLGCNPGYFTLQGTNTYIVGKGRSRLLIDCGEPDVPEYIETLKKVVQENDISLSKIIITHWHPDHVGGTKDVLKEVADKDCKVYKYKDTKHDPLYSDLFELNYLKNEDEVQVEGATIKMHHTPGHATDHLSIYLKEEDTLFSGDNVLGEGSVVFEDLLSYLQSLNKLIALNPKKLYPGHGPIVENPINKVKEYIDRRLAREKQIVNMLETTDGYMSAMDIVKATYEDLPHSLLLGAEYSTTNHLKKLVAEKRVEILKTDGDLEDITIKYRLKRDTWF